VWSIEMRDFKDVMERIKNEVPDSFEKKKEMLAAIDSRIDSYYYTAPEAMPQRWGEATDILMMYVPKVKEDWQCNIANIFNDTEETT